VPTVRLERMGREHLDLTLAWLQDSELRAAIDSRGVPTRAEHVSYWSRRHGSNSEECYAILVDGLHVGNCGLIFASHGGTAELWLYLGEETSRGKGVGRHAAELLLDRAFGELGLRRAVVRVLIANLRARQFWLGFGFRERNAGEGRSVWLDLEAPSMRAAR
jgi:RimJ/RimL family protein N-acetyltransferase